MAAFIKTVHVPLQTVRGDRGCDTSNGAFVRYKCLLKRGEMGRFIDSDLCLSTPRSNPLGSGLQERKNLEGRLVGSQQRAQSEEYLRIGSELYACHG